MSEAVGRKQRSEGATPTEEHQSDWTQSKSEQVQRQQRQLQFNIEYHKKIVSEP